MYTIWFICKLYMSVQVQIPFPYKMLQRGSAGCQLYHHPVSDVLNFLLVHNVTRTEGGTAWVPAPPASPPESPHPSASPLLCAGALTFPHVPKPAPAEGTARDTVLGNTRLTAALTPLSSAAVHAFHSLKPKKNGKILGIRKLTGRRALLETF